MSRKIFISAFITAIAIFNIVIGNTASADYAGRKDNKTSAQLSAAAKNGSHKISSFSDGSGITPLNSAITNESCAANNAADPGEMLSVDLTLQNTGGGNTSNLTATLLPTEGVIATSAAQNYGTLNIGSSATRNFTLTIDPNVAPGSTVMLTLVLADGVTDLGTVNFTLPVGSTPGAAVNFDYNNVVPLRIPDGDAAGVNSTVNVSGVNGEIQNLSFVVTGTAASNTNPSTTVGIDHSWIGDLTVKLTSPAGTTVTLIDRINGVDGSDGQCPSNNIFNLKLDDSATTLIDDGCPGSNTTSGPLTGNFKPQNPLAAFKGQNANGTWTVNVSDVSQTDSGFINSYRLGFTLPATAACQGKIWTGAVSSDWSDADNWSPAGVPAATDSIVIPASGVTNNPNIINPNVTVKNLTLVNPRVLTVSDGSEFNVTGTALINGTLAIAGNASLGTTPGLSGSNFVYNGVAQQTIANLPYNNLTIDNAAGTLLSGNVTVNGTLTLTDGIVDANGNTLSVANCSAAGISGGSTTSYIKGNLNRCAKSGELFVFPVGTANGYSPVTAAVTNGTGNLAVKANQGAHPKAPNANNRLLRSWSLSGDGVTADLTFNYLDPVDIQGDESLYRLFKISGETAVEQTDGVTLDTAANTASVTGVSSFADWTLSAAPPLFAVSGTVKYGSTPDNEPTKFVSGVKMSATGTASASATTDAAGAYALNNLNTGSYTVTAEKTGNANGITPFDAVLILRCLAAGTNCALTANQKAAADTNGDKNITPFDATLVLRYAAAGAPTANTGQIGNWKFIPASREYSPLDSSLSGEDYTAILVGEVNGSWTPPAP